MSVFSHNDQFGVRRCQTIHLPLIRLEERLSTRVSTVVIFRIINGNPEVCPSDLCHITIDRIFVANLHQQFSGRLSKFCRLGTAPIVRPSQVCLFPVFVRQTN